MDTKTKTYRVGDARITRVTDTLLHGLTPTYLYGDWDAGLLNEQPRLRGLLDDNGEHVTLSVHTWVIEWGGQVILIDTGIGNHKARPFSALFHQLQTPFLERLAAIGIQPADVAHVLLTHLHVDHVGWNTRLVDGQWLPTFPNARYVMPQGDLDFFASPAGEGRRMVYDDSVAPVIAAGQSVVMGGDGGAYLEGFHFHPTPGHCAGHMSISLTSRGETALFTGDVVHTPMQIYRPQWNSVFCADQDQARTSRRWLLDFAVEQDALVLPAHFTDTSAGRVTHQDGGFAWQFV
ncbi:MAG: MBL fold metallo-hydrolase [Paludibacterium sp.]|uniref:MBL fold metallo-hydrolase n=1 Tax=Paludibacterium sp. TaxID=1917523 RepID=UPI0025DCBC02|nr:MBL fold metallo-hydrolase [Paludibacterium sp.]MBV8047393.1 MBL fold metallo-hydrolase [Paludibacterium sp.]MBV8646854.1 MBL fold metallo-hydrolase [Paludibacterium sp.]